MTTTMATVALPRPIAPHRAASTIGSLSSPITLDSINTQSTQCSTLVPNKHIPVCPPGPVPQEEPTTPPPSPGRDATPNFRSLLSPPDKYPCLESGPVSLYKIGVEDVAAALAFQSQQLLPDPSQVFPWLHGLHPSNHIQMAFFINRRRGLRRTPSCLRGIAVVKADGDLGVARLKGAICPQEILQPGQPPEFLDVDPREGFSVRNFQIQPTKSAMTSDIIVYGEDESLVRRVAWDIAAAQLSFREKHEAQRLALPVYNTFICTDPFARFEELAPEIVSVDRAGRLTGHVISFVDQERREMCSMTQASEISHNVWLGPTPPEEEESEYDVLIDCTDMGRLNPGAIRSICEGSGLRKVEFPSSGSILAPTWSHAEADAILESCKWIYYLAHGKHPAAPATGDTDDDGDISMAGSPDCRTGSKRREKKILIHCVDGYTESTMLAIAYYSYSTGLPVPDAWLHLHTTMKRNFFAYPTDVALLTTIAPRLLYESPVCAGKSLSDVTAMMGDEPRWLAGLDGSFPSRITDYMYLGNLGHANNPDLLKALGITQILSVGEMAMWREGELEEWGPENTCTVQGVQDNGIDPLTDEFERCLAFIGKLRLTCWRYPTTPPPLPPCPLYLTYLTTLP